MPAKILPFVSRSEQLRLRSWRDYSRYMLVVKGFVAADSLERAQWQKEYAKDARRDAEWKLRHGPAAVSQRFSCGAQRQTAQGI